MLRMTLLSISKVGPLTWLLPLLLGSSDLIFFKEISKRYIIKEMLDADTIITLKHNTCSTQINSDTISKNMICRKLIVFTVILKTICQI